MIGPFWVARPKRPVGRFLVCTERQGHHQLPEAHTGLMFELVGIIVDTLRQPGK